MTSEIQNLADNIIGHLKANGFILHVYKGVNSIYIKCDYGVCNTIRVANHPGKKHLQYRYVIGPHINKIRTANNNHKYPTYEYPADKAFLLITAIIQQKRKLLDRYGEDGYRRLMEYRKPDEKTKSYGFWRDCVRVC